MTITLHEIEDQDDDFIFAALVKLVRKQHGLNYWEARRVAMKSGNAKEALVYLVESGFLTLNPGQKAALTNLSNNEGLMQFLKGVTS